MESSVVRIRLPCRNESVCAWPSLNRACAERKKIYIAFEAEECLSEREETSVARARACMRACVRACVEDVLLRYLAPLSIVHVSHVPFRVELRENQDLFLERGSSKPSIRIFEIIDRA